MHDEIALHVRDGWLGNHRLKLSSLSITHEHFAVMPVKRRLLRKEITYSEAKASTYNIVHELSYEREQLRFYNHVYRHRDDIAALVAHHFGLYPSACQVEEPTEWMKGSFNLCVPVRVGTLRRVIMRFPLPYRTGEKFRPGNGDEKVRCEAATYAWIGQECPSIPIPHLYGFGLSTGQLVSVLTSDTTMACVANHH